MIGRCIFFAILCCGIFAITTLNQGNSPDIISAIRKVSAADDLTVSAKNASQSAVANTTEANPESEISSATVTVSSFSVTTENEMSVGSTAVFIASAADFSTDLIDDLHIASDTEINDENLADNAVATAGEDIASFSVDDLASSGVDVFEFDLEADIATATLPSSSEEVSNENPTTSMVADETFLTASDSEILDEIASYSDEIASAGSTASSVASLPFSYELPSAPVVELPDPVKGNGDLSLTIESFAGGNPKRISQVAQRVEVWLGDRRLASLNQDDPEVVTENRRRLFVFPNIRLPQGFYFITVRCYGPAALYGRQKWHGETFQVGIHPDKTSRVSRRITFFHW